MKILVLGAGVVGTASAWYLRQAGHDVRVLERQAGAAQETSFANGGQISVSHAEPWANPATLRKVLTWLGKDDAPLLFRPRLDPLQWRWALHYLRECLPSRVSRNMRQIVALAEYSRQSLQALRRETGIAYDHLERGILHFYTDQQEFDKSQAGAALLRELGCPRNTVSADEVIRLEPALRHARGRIVGGDFTASDESGDARVFTQAQARRGAARGVRFFYNHGVQRLRVAGGMVKGVDVRAVYSAACNTHDPEKVLHLRAIAP